MGKMFEIILLQIQIFIVISNHFFLTLQKGTGKKLVTGYILYSSDVRKSVASRFPESTFGEISRIVGNEWRSLSGIEKQGYEERAAKLNEETTARLALEALGPGETPHQDLIFECHWDSCDHQFEELNDLLEHAVGEPDGHVQKHFVTKPGKFHAPKSGSSLNFDFIKQI
jgi:protein polybromo-1